jgi:hypothetical protein
MNNAIRLNRFMRFYYPHTIFLFAAFVWSTVGHPGSHVAIRFPKMDEPNLGAPTASQACSDDRLTFLKKSSCELDDDNWKLIDKNHNEPDSSQLYVL